MSEQYPGGWLTKSPPTPANNYETTPAPGVWNLTQQAALNKQGLWPTVGNLAPGQQAYTTPGTYSWVAPAGVTSVSVVCVGGGGGASFSNYYGGQGGSLSYKNNITVTPGASYTVIVGDANLGSGNGSSFVNSSTVYAPNGANGNQTPVSSGLVGNGGGYGGRGGFGTTGSGGGIGGGGGAGGYSGSGGRGGDNFKGSGLSGSGGGGGGGGAWSDTGANFGAGGGGVGILGSGANGAGGQGTTYPSTGGGGGSGGSQGSNSGSGSGGNYGGGGGGNPGAVGAVRIIWPGDTRSFPSTNTGDL